MKESNNWEIKNSPFLLRRHKNKVQNKPKFVLWMGGREVQKIYHSSHLLKSAIFANSEESKKTHITRSKEQLG
jgi:hypothetical protein